MPANVAHFQATDPKAKPAAKAASPAPIANEGDESVGSPGNVNWYVDEDREVIGNVGNADMEVDGIAGTQPAIRKMVSESSNSLNPLSKLVLA